MDRRPVLGFLIAPLAPCVLAATVLAISHGDFLVLPIAILLYAFFAYSFGLMLGVPAYFLISRLGYLSMLQVTFAGSLLGFISGAILPFVIGTGWPSADSSGMSMLLLIFTGFGTVTAWVFWWLSIRPYSNNSFKSAASRTGTGRLRRPVP